jgi:hypothetical protein
LGPNPLMISKSDFRLYREAPRHLWAKKHGCLEISSAEKLAGIQGEQVELLAMEYIEKYILPRQPGRTLLWQETRKDGVYTARADAIVCEAGGDSADLYEIKSSTGVKDEDVEDVAFQALIFQKHFHIRHFYLVLINHAYIFDGSLDLGQLLKVEDITAQTGALQDEIKIQRAQAWEAAQCATPEGLEHCWKPDECSCREVCHPGLPDFSIYNIPRLSLENKRLLESMGIRAAQDIPASFKLSGFQRQIADLARRGEPLVDEPRIRAEMAKVAFPIYFLDYETCNLAVPQYPRYIPYQQNVFQYSLYRLDTPTADPEHFEYLSTCPGDPALPLLASLREDMGRQGTIIVWNAAFEKSRNKEMAEIYPEYRDFLLDVNGRIYDLMEMVSKGLYLHPGFRGSSSIKHVLPAMVPELSYAEMEINNGTKASLGWWKLTFEPLNENERNKIVENLLAYCKMDTLAMVEIYRKFAAI